ncbi:MAG: AMP-binding protein [Nocardioidaceae bacterium]
MSTANLSRMLGVHAIRYADHEALVFEGRRWTFRELDEQVNALAVGLLAQGLQQASRVAVVASNVPEYLMLSLAVAKIGAVTVPLNYRLTSGELAQLMQHAQVEAVATVPEFRDLTEAALESLDIGLRLALEPIGEGWTDVGELIVAHKGARVGDVELDDDALQRIVYTSGTTSLPKGVMLTHGNVNANMHAQILEFGILPGDRILNVSPLYHVGGTDLPGYGIWHAGACMVLMRRFDAVEVLGVLAQERITGTVLASTMLDMIRRAATGKEDLSSVKWLMYGQVSLSLFHELRPLFPRARLIEGYGLTETCGGLTYVDADHAESKHGSVGVPVPWVDVRIFDESDREVGPGQEGEVVARGPKVSPGYLDDGEATSNAFRGGWFHTGDIGLIDGDGYLYIRDRLKDMIRSGAENIASAEVESVLAGHPQVLAVAVVGAPHPKWVEVPVAFVVGRSGLEAADLVEYASSRLGKFKLPKEIYLIEEFPTNPSGKILKRELREQLPSRTPDWAYEGPA